MNQMDEFDANTSDQKEEIKQYIRDGIKSEVSLVEIKKLIFEKSKRFLNCIEENYVHHKYIKYCLKQFLEELPILFSEMLGNKFQDIKDFTSCILKIKTAENVFDLFSNAKSLKPIFENAHLLLPADRNWILVEFKQNFIDYLQEKFVDAEQHKELFSQIEQELTHLFSIYDIHKYTKENRFQSNEVIDQIQEVTFLSKLIDLERTPTGTWKDMINTYAKFHFAFKRLLTNSQINLTRASWEQIAKMFIYHSSPVTFEIEEKERRRILVAKGVYISLSRILSNLEKRLTESKSVEFCLSALETLFIDCDLNNQTWHGVNIAIRAKRIKVMGKHTINVSGLDGEPQKKPPKAQNGRQGSSEETKNGRHGRDGAKGESGGNVIIRTCILENDQNWIIESNGGNGGYGQDGGNGANGEDGEDGHGLTIKQLETEFPSAAKLLDADSDKIASTTFECIKLITIDTPTCKRWSKEGCLPSYYVEGTTEQGNTIYYSLYSGWTSRQAYCLYTGTCGEPGQSGGFGGLGGYAGEPGFAGDVQVSTNRNEKSKIGIKVADGFRVSDGKSGKDGKNGKSGENKPDVAYIDWSFWLEARYYEPSWYRISIYDSKAPDRIADAEFDDRSRYVAIEPRSKPDPPACVPIDRKARKKHEQTKEKKAEATRKHVVSNELLTETFDEYQNEMSVISIENSQISIDLFREELTRLHIEEENIERGNISINKAFIQEKHFKLPKTSLQCHSNQCIPVDSFGKIKRILDDFQKSLHDPSEPTVDYIVQISNELQCTTLSYENTLNLLSAVEHGQSIWEKLQLPWKTSNDDDNYKNLKTLIIQKVKLSLLEKIARIIDNNVKNIKDGLLEQETESGTNSAIHSTLGSRNEFNIYQSFDCKSIRQNLKENLPQIVKDHPEIWKSLDQSITEYFPSVEHQDTFPCMKRYAERSLQKNTLKFGHILPVEYGNYISSDEQAFNKYDVVLLAYLHNICINVHVLSDDHPSSLKLFSAYNEKSSNVQHVLYLSNQFIKLSVKKMEDKNAKCLRYNQILNDVQQLKTSDQFREYFDNKLFESPKNPRKVIDQFGETTVADVIQLFDMNIRERLRLSLTMISPKFLSGFNLFKSLKDRFIAEKVLINHEIITSLSMSISNSYSNGENLTVYQWIINAYPQNEWINEFTLMKFERLTDEPYKKISNWRSLLRKIDNKQIIELLALKIEDVPDTFDVEKLLLQLSECYLKEAEFGNILIHLQLNQWSIKLSHFDFIHTIQNALHQSESNDEQDSTFDSDFSRITYYLYTLKNKSEILVNQFLEIAKQKQLSTKQCLDIVEKFCSGHWTFGDETLNKIRDSPNDTIETINTKQNLPLVGWNGVLLGDRDERKSKKLIEIIKKDESTSIKDKLTRLEVFLNDLNKSEFIQINQVQKLIGFLTIEDIKEWSIEFKSRPSQINHLAEVLRVIERTIAILFPKISSLRDAQKLTILSFILNETNLLAQVSTGEGKSLIIASIMIIKCLFGHSGDIITSSPVLAERDASANEKFFDAFGISVAHNSSESLIERRNAYEKQIVYGDLSSFQRDYLLDHFYNKRILGDRYENGRANIIVDEVDSMLLDKGNSVLYLSHQPPCLDTLEDVFVFIWQIILINATDGTHPTDHDIKRIVLQNLDPLLDKNELKKLTKNQEIVDQIWDELIDQNSIDDNGKIVFPEVTFNDQALKPFNKHVKYLLKEIFYYERKIEVPNYLKVFIEQHLSAWIESAKKALEMEEGGNYTIDVDKSATKLDKYPNIIIVDCDTGVDQLNSQWNEGLHQFLQLKHQCKTSLPSLKAVFISNISFFNMYQHIYGLSGTLGSESERKFFRSTYEVDLLTMPVALPSKFREDRPILCKDLLQWRKIIVEQSLRISIQRSVLVICETIQDVKEIHQTFLSQANFSSSNIYVYKRSYETFSIEHDGLDIGKIIIATNLAGRGTDIKITEQLDKNGGLHVILTYLPENYRIEQQAFGRTARKGQNGSGQLIFIDQFSNEVEEISSELHIIDLKNERDYNELCRVGEIRHYYETVINFEEQLFNRYQKAYNLLKGKLEGTWKTADDIKDIVLHSLLNKWAFWLDEISSLIESNTMEVVQLLEEFIHGVDQIQYLNDAIKQLVSEPSQLIKIAKCYINDEKYQEASHILDQVIHDEPQFCHAAYYYKAHCIVKHTGLKSDENKADFNRSLDHAELLFQHQIDRLTQRNAAINKSSQSTVSFMSIESYRIQNENLCHLYSNFIRSIHDIRGHPVTPSILSSIDIDLELATRIYNQLLDPTVNILNERQFNQNFNEKQLETICKDYRLDYERTRTYLHEKNSVNENDMKTYFEEIQIPSREHFWQLLVEHGVITEEKHVIIIGTKEIDEKNGKLKELIDRYGNKLKPINEMKPSDKSQLFFERVNFVTENLKFAYDSGDEKYQSLEQQKLILTNRIGTINMEKLQKLPNEHFQAMTINDLLIEDLDINDSKNIYDKLVKQKIIDQETGVLLSDDFSKLKLDEYQIYEQSIITIINCHCLYKRQILEILHQYHASDCDAINLSLTYNLHKDFLYDLEAALIIKPVHYNYSKINVSLFEKVRWKDYASKLEEEIQSTCETEKKISKSIVTSLQNTIGKINYLSSPNSYLNSIERNFDGNERFEHIKELDVFTINGLDHFISLEDTKWSRYMVISTAVLTGFAIAEIVGGVFLELYSMGIGTHVAAGLISEGMNDILYAFSAMRSGQFSWNDYLVHKIHSVMFTVATMGIAAFLARGVRFSRFGSKLVGETGFLSRVSGTKLINAASQTSMEGVSNNLMKKVWCRAGVKLAEGFALAGVNTLVSCISEKLFKDYCGKIVNELFLNIRKAIEEQKDQLRNSLGEIYKRFGEALTQKWLADIDHPTNSDAWYRKVSQWISKIAQLISGGVSAALRKMHYDGHSSKFTKIASTATVAFSAIMKGGAYSVAIGRICLETKTFINDNVKKLQEKADECKTENTSISSNMNENELNRLVERTAEQWNKTLETKIDTDIRTKIIEPILCQGANALLRKLGKTVQKYHQREKDNLLWKKFQLSKTKYEIQKTPMENQEEISNRNEVSDEITRKYNRSLLLTMAKTRDPDLIAAIIEEGGPMDTLAIQALSNNIGQPIKIKNADGITFPSMITPQGMKIENNEDENSPSIEFTPGDGITTFGHFSSAEETNDCPSTATDNNCLIYAIMQAKGVDIRLVNGNDVRREIAKEIRTNLFIKNIIQNGHHRYYTSHCGFGGVLSSKQKQILSKLREVSHTTHIKLSQFHNLAEQSTCIMNHLAHTVMPKLKEYIENGALASKLHETIDSKHTRTDNYDVPGLHAMKKELVGIFTVDVDVKHGPNPGLARYMFKWKDSKSPITFLGIGNTHGSNNVQKWATISPQDQKDFIQVTNSRQEVYGVRKITTAGKKKNNLHSP